MHLRKFLEVKTLSDYNYSGPIEVDSGIFWVGFADDNAGLHCNPYLIVEEDEAILIDGGSGMIFLL